jgi:hypothetical protein
MRALAAVAGIEEEFSADDFFTAYAKALARGGATGPGDQVARYQARVLAFLTAVTSLSPSTGSPDKPTVVTYRHERSALARTKEVLALFG